MQLRLPFLRTAATLVLLGFGANFASAALIAHWPLNDGPAGSPVTGAAEIIDGNLGVHKNAVTTAPGAPGGTWVNDATRGIVFSTGENDRLFAGTQGIDRNVGFAWSLWANIDDINITDATADVLIGTRSAQPGNIWNKIEVGATGGDGAQNWAVVPLLNSISDDTWHHVTYLGDTTSVRLYIDGVLIGSDATTPTPTFNGNLEFGGSAQFSEDTTALMSDVGIWDEALTNDEVKGLYDVTRNLDLMIYDAGQFNLLKQLHDAGTGSVDIGDLTWSFATGLTGPAGLSGSLPGFTLVLNTQADTGLISRPLQGPIPEPATAALALLGLAGLTRRRRAV